MIHVTILLNTKTEHPGRKLHRSIFQSVIVRVAKFSVHSLCIIYHSKSLKPSETQVSLCLIHTCKQKFGGVFKRVIVTGQGKRCIPYKTTPLKRSHPMHDTWCGGKKTPSRPTLDFWCRLSPRPTRPTHVRFINKLVLFPFNFARDCLLASIRLYRTIFRRTLSSSRCLTRQRCRYPDLDVLTAVSTRPSRPAMQWK